MTRRTFEYPAVYLLGTAYKIATHCGVRRIDDGRAGQYTLFCHPQGVVRYYQSENFAPTIDGGSVRDAAAARDTPQHHKTSKHKITAHLKPEKGR